MCGFAGFLELPRARRSPAARGEILARMGAALAHRGPDDAATYDDGTLAFAFRRLSIVDVDGGAQPLFSEDGALVVAVNGEIYNHAELRPRLRGAHAFATGSDAEICVHLLEERGERMLAELNGIFALLAWDRRRRRLLLARDRLGVKPLYWTRVAGGIVFGSELKGVLAHPDVATRLRWRDVDWSHLDDGTYTAVDYLELPSFAEGVEQLEGGALLTLAADAPVPATRRWWSLDAALAAASEAPPRPAGEYVEAYGELLSDSVRLQLMSDVPVGAFLSGGLDSSVLVAAAAAHGAAPHCFTVDEATTAATGDLDRARDLADELGLGFTAARFDHARFAEQLDFSLASFEYFIWMIDAPRFAPESFFKHELHRVLKTLRPEIKVVLLGQGADEFAGGYSRSYSSPRASWDAYLHDALAPQQRALAARALGAPAAVAPLLASAALAPYQREMLARTRALQSHNLWNEDRVSSSQGVEARVPFLDHRLVELLASIPPSLHEPLFFDKAIVRRAAARWLPERWTAAPKVLFWQADDTSSVHRLMRACLDRAYPEFRERYADGPFELAALDELARRAHAADGDWSRASRALLSAMGLAVFDRLCRTLPAGAPAPPRLAAPSPLVATAPSA